jgi:hypothetical protein
MGVGPEALSTAPSCPGRKAAKKQGKARVSGSTAWRGGPVLNAVCMDSEAPEHPARWCIDSWCIDSLFGSVYIHTMRTNRMVCITLSPAAIEALSALSAKRGVSKSGLIDGLILEAASGVLTRKAQKARKSIDSPKSQYTQVPKRGTNVELAEPRNVQEHGWLDQPPPPRGRLLDRK